MAGVKSAYLREIDRRALRTIWKPYLFAACFIALGMLVLCHGCTYSGHSIKAEVGREVGESLKGSVYKVGCEVKFEPKRGNQ